MLGSNLVGKLVRLGDEKLAPSSLGRHESKLSRRSSLDVVETRSQETRISDTTPGRLPKS